MNLPELPKKHLELVEAEKIVQQIRARRLEVETELRKVEAVQAQEHLDLDDVAERIASGTVAQLSVPDAAADLQHQLNVLDRAGRKARLRLTAETEEHKRRIVKTFRPCHKHAVQKILRAVELLVEANKEEEAVRVACPVPLNGVPFPHVGDWSANRVGVAAHWKSYVQRLGFLEPEPPAAPEKRRLFGRTNGAASPAPAVAAKSAD